MRTISMPAAVLIFLCHMAAGSAPTPSGKSVRGDRSQPQLALAQKQASSQVTAAAGETAAEFHPVVSRERGTVVALLVSAVETAAAETTKALPKDVVILRGSPLGAVKLEHKLHSQARKIKCETCHHPSKPEKPNKAAQQVCSDCHTKVATSPMKTKLQAAFHNPSASAGTCIGCHKAENAKGKAAPVKCVACHKKSNT